MDDFDAFAATDEQSRKGPLCMVCAVDQDTLDLIHRKHAEGHFGSLIGRYLRSKGHKIADGTVARHFRDRHDAR